MSVLSRYNVTPAQQPASLTPMQNLMALCDQVSVEAFASQTLGGYLTRKGAILSTAFKEAIGAVLTRDHSRPETLNVAALKRFLSTFDYTDLQNINLNKPVGMNQRFEPYAIFLAGSPLEHLVGLIPMVLIPAQKRFAYYLNNIQEIGQKHKFEYGSLYTVEALAQMVATQGQFSTEGNHTATATFGELFENKDQFTNTANVINLLNEQRYRKASPELVNREVQKLATVADALLTSLSSNGDEASSQFVGAISEEIRTVAKWVEWYSVTTVQCLDATTAMKLNEGVVFALE